MEKCSGDIEVMRNLLLNRIYNIQCTISTISNPLANLMVGVSYRGVYVFILYKECLSCIMPAIVLNKSIIIN